MHAVVLSLSRGFAYLGGLVLAALIVMICASVLGRAVADAAHAMLAAGWFPVVAQAVLDAGIGAIKGDFELVEAGIAFAIFAFLPLCHITGGHAAVDVFTRRLPPRADRALRAITESVFAAVLVLIAVQLGAGAQSKWHSGQTTFLLQFPLWWAYGLSLVAALVAALVATYMAVMRLVEMWLGRDILPEAA
ncbi:TRAP transporter small permease (plasmid) [Pseudorhodobacter turbinis]|uniref:TRAP transporter small permease protein n=1 Tax=Pseudorhodobacter turbinis TaxID=2500533 RepID=A0A4P8ELH5_9RHOB|nr:TRAP transporter small permease subunit [Pseudorhodobacter turbinis]QCO57918.1 TRAP transporter small permease [Pseudorhodobacter turbinis]